MSRKNYLFTSESVSEGHPDKVCDRISDEIVDLFYREALEQGMDPAQVRVACETFATTNRVIIGGESRGPSSVTHAKIEDAARRAIKAIGYEQNGFTGRPPRLKFCCTTSQPTLPKAWIRAPRKMKALATGASCLAMPAMRRQPHAGAALIRPAHFTVAGGSAPFRQGKGPGA
jgi:S-adenosylmethionine synthetase